MTRKDYKVIAEAIRQTKEFYEKDIPDNYMVSQILLSASVSSRIVECLSNAMMEDNPRFNRDKFREACGL